MHIMTCIIPRQGLASLLLICLTFTSSTAADPDTLHLGNRNFFTNGSSTVFYDQSCLVFTPAVTGKLIGIDLRFQNITNNNGNDSRLFFSRAKSWSCGGPADPLGGSEHILAVSDDLSPQATQWNRFLFSEELWVFKDSVYFIWPDAARQISHHLSWADSPFSTDIGCLFAATCSNPPSTNDYAAEFILATYDCLDHQVVTTLDSLCYSADTLRISASIGAGQDVFLFFQNSVEMIPDFEVAGTGTLTADRIYCRE